MHTVLPATYILGVSEARQCCICPADVATLQSPLHGSHRAQVELAPIQIKLPEEMMLFIFSRLAPYTIGKAACVCQQWRTYAEVGPCRQ